MEEHRRHPRHHAPVLTLHVKEGETLRRRYFRDLSMTGIHVHTRAVAQLHAAVELRLSSPDGTAVDLRGRVVRVIEEEAVPNKRVACGMAIEFDPGDEDAAANLTALLQSYAPESTTDPS